MLCYRWFKFEELVSAGPVRRELLLLWFSVVVAPLLLLRWLNGAALALRVESDLSWCRMKLSFLEGWRLIWPIYEECTILVEPERLL